MDMTDCLEQKFGKLPKTLFFEYTNIEVLASHLFSTYGERYQIGEKEVSAEEAEQKTESEYVTVEADSKSVGNQITKIIQEITKISVEQSEWETGFYELGMDSANLLDLVNQLEQMFQIELYPTLLFEYTSVKTLSDYLVQNYGEQLNGKVKEKIDEKINHFLEDE